MPLQVELVSADRKVWSGDASMVVARTVDGELGILPGHAPLLAVLAGGEVRISPEQSEAAKVVAEVDGGFLSVEHDRITVVCGNAALTAGAGSTGA